VADPGQLWSVAASEARRRFGFVPIEAMKRKRRRASLAAALQIQLVACWKYAIFSIPL